MSKNTLFIVAAIAVTGAASYYGKQFAIGQAEARTEQAAIGRALSWCEVFRPHGVEAISRCESDVAMQFRLEQRHGSSRDPDVISQKVVAELFPDDREVQRRRSAGLDCPYLPGYTIKCR